MATTNMENQVEDRIRQLAKPLWVSAGEQYGTALDCWLMAENMILETMAATTKIVGAALDTSVSARKQFWEVPTEVPTERVRELAYLMWEAAGRQHGAATDFWLAAERHVLTVMRTGMGAAADADTPNVLAKELLLGSSAAYLDRVRELAHSIWLSAGQECGRSLDFWLDAERRVLGAMTATKGFSAPSPSKELPAPKSPQPRKQAAKAKPARARKPAN
jgi:hypothetical protein